MDNNMIYTVFIKDLVSKLKTHKYEDRFDMIEEHCKSLDIKQLHAEGEMLEDKVLSSMVHLYFIWNELNSRTVKE